MISSTPCPSTIPRNSSFASFFGPEFARETGSGRSCVSLTKVGAGAVGSCTAGVSARSSGTAPESPGSTAVPSEDIGRIALALLAKTSRSRFLGRPGFPFSGLAVKAGTVRCRTTCSGCASALTSETGASSSVFGASCSGAASSADGFSTLSTRTYPFGRRPRRFFSGTFSSPSGTGTSGCAASAPAGEESPRADNSKIRSRSSCLRIWALIPMDRPISRNSARLFPFNASASCIWFCYLIVNSVIFRIRTDTRES